MDLIIFIILLALGYFVGTMFVERRHYASLEKRESKFLNLPVVTAGEFLEDKEVSRVGLVYGSVVVAADYFKLIMAGLRNILGGEVRSYETILDRARREAILRLKEKAKDADLILNLRLETSQIRIGCAEVLAYATAIYYKK